MKKQTEPRMIYDPREYEPAYISALEMSGGTSTRLDFSYFGALTTLPEHAKIPVGDITFDGHPVVIEVKTKGDLASSMMSGRLEWAIWHMYLLKLSGRVQGFAVLVRSISEPLHENAKASFLIARRALAKWSVRFGFTILIAEDPDDVIQIATSFMREFMAPKAVEMPPPIIPKQWLELDFGVVVISAIRGWHVERATRLLSHRPFWGVMLDAHEMDIDDFCTAYKQLHGFGGAENKLLRELWTWFNSADVVHEVDVRPLFRMKTSAELMHMIQEREEKQQ